MIGVVGSGSWGTALAQHLAVNGHKVRLWGRDTAQLAEIRDLRRNSRYLPALTLHDGIIATDSLTETVTESDVLLLVTPAQTLPALLPELNAAGLAQKTSVLCAKGIIIETGQLLTDLFDDKSQPAVLSGPTFAREVAMSLPTAATLACAHEQTGRELVQMLSGPMFRLYWSRDVIGTEIAGSLKNVLAIACGIVDGLGLGDNARAALITRGMTEIGRYVRYRGGSQDTLMGLCGIGDIALSCASHQSRNYSLGVTLGQGQSIDDLMKSRSGVAEGMPTALALARQITAHGLDMPICMGVAGIVSARANVHDIVDQLLQRPLRTDEEGA